MGEVKFCPECGHPAKGAKFCPNCGFKVSAYYKQTPVEDPSLGVVTQQTKEPLDIIVDDKKLKLLLDHYMGMNPSVRNMYSERVLYYSEEKDSYEIHVYKFTEGIMDHRAFSISMEKAEKMLQMVKALDLNSLKEIDLIQPDGGKTRVLKFRDEEDNLIRLDERNLGESRGKFEMVAEAFGDALREAEEIFTDYAKSWKAVQISSTSMNQMDCYNLQISREEDGSAYAMGNLHLEGGAFKALDNPYKLSEEAIMKLSKMRIGMLTSLNSNASSNRGIPGGSQMPIGMMAFDSSSKSINVTYGDGRVDLKTTDDGVMKDILQLVRKDLMEE